jgi:hypothetical protein
LLVEAIASDPIGIRANQRQPHNLPMLMQMVERHPATVNFLLCKERRHHIAILEGTKPHSMKENVAERGFPS